MEFVLPPLPYAKTALEPHMSAETFSYHHEKHHNAYVVKLGQLLEGKPEAALSLEEIVKTSSGGVFNQAAQVWNHTFFWNSMKPAGGGAPTGAIKDLIEKSFGSYEKFAEEFVNKGLGQFGSGWVWLVQNGDAVEIVTTSNAETPLTTSKKPLITADVWEHAYYIDARNDRGKFLKTFLANLVNWDFANQNLG